MQNAVHVEMLLQSFASSDSSFNKFSVGNTNTLQDVPNEEKVDVHREMENFYRRFYSANIMTLVLIDRVVVQRLQEIAIDKFGPLINNWAERPLVGKEPFPPESRGILVRYVPVQGTPDNLILVFPLEPTKSDVRSRSLVYIASLLSYSGSGSLQQELKNQGLVTRIRISPVEYE